MKMRHVATSRRIDAAAPEVWRVIIDTRLWPEWGPTVRAVDYPSRWLTTEATGRVQTIGGVWLPFAVTHFEDGREWSWSVAGVPATGHRLVSLGANETELTFTVPWLAAPYVPVLRRGLALVERLALGGAGHHVASAGEGR